MTSDRPNIIFVSMDSLRADHCGHLGDERGLTPTLDWLAEEGVAYETAIAPGPRTFSTMPAVFTGHHQATNNVDNYPGSTQWEQRLAAIEAHLGRYSSLPERLRRLGYSTAGLSPNPWTSSASGFDRGFDRFVDFSGNEGGGLLHKIADRLPALDTNDRTVELILEMLSGKSFFTQWGDFYDEIEAVRSQLTEPYFLWVFLLDTHYPFITSRAYREEQSMLGMYLSTYRSADAMRGNTDSLSERAQASLERSYRDAVRASDEFMARLLADRSADDPVTILHSDHGEAFGEHGSYGHHHGHVFEENIHVPYVVHNAGVEQDVSGPVSLCSIPDTTMTIASRGTFDPHESTEPHVYSSNVRGNRRAVRGERFKYVESGGERMLFDLTSDPEEQDDVTNERASIRREFENYLTSYEAHLDQLEELGHTARSIAAVDEL